MIYKSIIGIILLLTTSTCLAVPESRIRDMDCHNRGGVAEYRNIDGTYTDCLTDSVAIEYDFANKWYECITQAGYYGLLSGLQPVCVLILRKDGDMRYVHRAIRFVYEYHRKPITILYLKMGG